ncbi:MAG: IS701 family transposase [Actinobacteria bacterium]|nr:IS701 family transposase [Actinomycetota bacterium]
MEAAFVLDAPAVETRERLLGFVDGVVSGLPHVRQRENAGLYVRGLIEQGGRKSLQPTLFRLEETAARYESLQQFLADSPWDPMLVVRACAERVCPELGVEAWVLDDTGFPKQGKHSPGVKRQYSGTLGKIGNCQLGVSVHALGRHGTAPLGWALYLPEEWCDDPQRRAKAKIPGSVAFKTKPELGVELVEEVAGWEVPAAPVLGDQAYGDNTKLRERLHGAGSEYVLAVGAATTVFAPETVFAVPEPSGSRGRPKSRSLPDREPETISELIARIGSDHAQTVGFRDGPDGKPVSSRFLFVPVRAAHDWQKATPCPPREELLIAEWPEGSQQPSDYWITNLPADTDPERLARLARLRWKIELDYKQLKGELGLDHYEGRSWIGWHHHTALVTVAHGFLTLERLCPPARRLA